MEVTLNGTRIVEADLDPLARRNKQHPGLKRKKGYIGIQDHGTRVEFRNLRIMQLEVLKDPSSLSGDSVNDLKSRPNRSNVFTTSMKQGQQILQLLSEQEKAGAFGSPTSVEKMQEFTVQEVRRRKQDGRLPANVNFKFTFEGEARRFNFEFGKGRGR